MCRITSKDVAFGGMSFSCGGSDTRGMLGSVGLRVRSKRAVKVVKKAKDTGADLIGLVDHLCSIASKRVLINKGGMGRCSLRILHGRISMILRGGILFAKDVLSGLH